MNFGSKIYESSEYSKPKVVGIHQPSGLLRKTHRTHDNKKIAFAKTPDTGLGVYSKESIRDGEVIEIAPLIIVDSDAMSVNNLDDYIFTINKEKDQYAIALGYGSIYNHSDDPNAEWNIDQEKEQLRIIAIKDIQEGQEINVSYGKNYWETRK